MLRRRREGPLSLKCSWLSLSLSWLLLSEPMMPRRQKEAKLTQTNIQASRKRESTGKHTEQEEGLKTVKPQNRRDKISRPLPFKVSGDPFQKSQSESLVVAALAWRIGSWTSECWCGSLTEQRSPNRRLPCLARRIRLVSGSSNHEQNQLSDHYSCTRPTSNSPRLHRRHPSTAQTAD